MNVRLKHLWLGVRVGGALLFSGCANRQTASFKDGRPVFDPADYFRGQTRSSGVIESRSGRPTQVLTTQAQGRWVGETFHFEQDLAFEKGRREHRSWRLRRIDAHHFTATGTDIVGGARGEAYGNVFHLEFTVATSPGNPFLNVHLSQWMYLQPDGCTMVNRATLSKAGIIVAQITEQFTKQQR